MNLPTQGSKMDEQSTTTLAPQQDASSPPDNYAMRELLSVHRISLSILCVASLVMGMPLKAHILWHLRHRSR